MNDIELARLKKLETAVTEAAFNLFEYTKSNGFRLQLPGTNPPVYVIIGPAAAMPDLTQGLDDKGEEKGEFELN